MKKAFFILLLLNSFFVDAQHHYIPIPTDSAIWITANFNWGTTKSAGYDVGRVENVDTLYANGKTYSCYFGDWSCLYMPPPPPKSMPAKGSKWIRQDTVNKKVWYNRYYSLTNEELLYDFSLQKGDTITDSNYYYFSPQRLYPYKAWIDDVDSVYLDDGLWHYRWWIKSLYGSSINPAHAIMIEGIGYTNNFIDDPLLEYHPMGTVYKKLVCYSLKNQWIYKQPNPWNADCDSMLLKNMAPTGIDEVWATGLDHPMLYPNPVLTDGILNLNVLAGKQDDEITIMAFNSLGQCMLLLKTKPGYSFTTNNLTPGLYFFKLLNKDQQTIQTQRILIQ